MRTAIADPETSTRPTVWLITVTFLVIVAGMGWTIGWEEIVHHHPWWQEPADTWGLVRGAHWIDWGSFSYIYSAPRTTIVTLPGLEILLAPFAALSSALHLSETAPGLVPIPKPTAWLIYGPLFLSTAGVAIFAFDALARTLQVTLVRRRLLALAVGASLWHVLAMWGHPEDVLALALAVFALASAFRGHWTAAGWLLGGALVMQLYVVALVPIFLGLAGRHRAAALLARAAVIPGFVFLAVVIPDPHATFRVLLQQRALPTLLHPTPWIAIAPHLSGHIVAGGPVRIIGLTLACGAGLLAARWRESPITVLWLVSATLTLRYLFDAVDIPYYVSPAIAIALLVALSGGRIRATISCILGGALIYFSYAHLGDWPYLILLASASIGMLVAAAPMLSPTPNEDSAPEFPQPRLALALAE